MSAYLDKNEVYCSVNDNIYLSILVNSTKKNTPVKIRHSDNNDIMIIPPIDLVKYFIRYLYHFKTRILLE